jgi:hypothetical protein
METCLEKSNTHRNYEPQRTQRTQRLRRNENTQVDWKAIFADCKAPIKAAKGRVFYTCEPQQIGI